MGFLSFFIGGIGGTKFQLQPEKHEELEKEA